MKFRGEPRVFPEEEQLVRVVKSAKQGASATCRQTHGVDEPATIEFLSNFLISEASCRRASFWHGVTLCDPPSEVGLSASGEASDPVNG